MVERIDRLPDISKTGMILWRAELGRFVAILEVDGVPTLLGTTRTIDAAQDAIDTQSWGRPEDLPPAPCLPCHALPCRAEPLRVSCRQP